MRKELIVETTGMDGGVHAILVRPDKVVALLVFAHGAGAGMKHPWMEAMAQALNDAGIATLRYQFPYMEKRAKRPDPKPVLLRTVRAAVARGGELAGKLPLFAGGKSMGGRMTSLAAAEEKLEAVNGLVFFGFPLHPSGAPSTQRADHLAHVPHPMLFLQGTRDSLADLSLLKPVSRKLPASTLHIIEGADHSFRILKSTGRSDKSVLEELAATVRDWALAL